MKILAIENVKFDSFNAEKFSTSVGDIHIAVEKGTYLPHNKPWVKINLHLRSAESQLESGISHSNKIILICTRDTRNDELLLHVPPSGEITSKHMLVHTLEFRQLLNPEEVGKVSHQNLYSLVAQTIIGHFPFTLTRDLLEVSKLLHAEVFSKFIDTDTTIHEREYNIVKGSRPSFHLNTRKKGTHVITLTNFGETQSVGFRFNSDMTLHRWSIRSGGLKISPELVSITISKDTLVLGLAPDISMMALSCIRKVQLSLEFI